MAPDGRLMGVAMLGGIIGALLAVGLTAWSGGIGTSGSTETAATGSASQPQLFSGAPALGAGISALVAKVAPSVVAINAHGPDGATSGSGVVIAPGNLVLTARRLLRNRASLTARVPSGQDETATVIGDDTDSGLALLRVAGPPLPVLSLASQTAVTAGDMAVLVGRLVATRPGSLTAGAVAPGTVTTLAAVSNGGAHVVVGEVRTVDGDPVLAGVPVLGILEADMAVDRDDLGAAVIDGRGTLIGVTVASDGGAGGASLATPSDVARAVVQELSSAGRVNHGYLGVDGGDASTELARSLGLAGGAVVTQVRTGSPAATAGVRAGDVVSAVDGRDVINMARLRALLRLHHPGDTVRLVLARRDETRTVEVTLGSPSTGPAAWGS